MRIGVDLGGTKIEAIALDDDGATLARERVPTPRGDYEATLHAVVSLVGSLERRLGRQGTVGIGIPGVISPATGRVKNANAVWLIGRLLDADLAARLGRPVRVENDANCFALSEALDGAGRGADVVFGVIVGTGTGGGLVVRGALVRGRHRIAGEWGHNPLPWPRADEHPGPPCYCGRAGCIEAFLSGPGLARAYAAETGEQVDAAEVVRRAAAGEPAAEAVLARYEDRMARALASLINVVDPDVIVLGGGLANVARLYDRVPRLWAPFVFSDRCDTPLVPPVHGPTSGVRGAARLWDL